MGAHPAHSFAEQASGGVAKLANLKIFHSESFHDAVAAHGFLQNLVELAETGLAAFHGAADAPAKFCDRPHDHREEHDGAEGHLPIDLQQHAKKNNEAKDLAENVGQIFGKREPGALDVVNHRGNEAAGGLVLEKCDGLANHALVNFVAQLSDGAVADGLDQHAAREFTERLGEKYDHHGNNDDGFNVVNAVREKFIQVDGMAAEGHGEERNGRVAGGGI